MTLNYRSQGGELNWLLDDLVNRVAQVRKAVMLTQDGLAIGASQGLSREDAEHLAALAAGFQSMARGAGQHFGGGQVRQTVIEMESAYLFVSAAGQGTCLAVLSTADADVGLIAYEMAVLVRRSNEHLGVGLRPGNGAAAQQQPMQPGPGPQSPYYVPPQNYPAPPAYAPGGYSPQQPPPRTMPQADPAYSPYPMPAGYPGPAPHAELSLRCQAMRNGGWTPRLGRSSVRTRSSAAGRGTRARSSTSSPPCARPARPSRTRPR
jgi:predicted regulator of Ras-like GTPase activity (Roadblock/LC7/MglB family)